MYLDDWNNEPEAPENTCDNCGEECVTEFCSDWCEKEYKYNWLSEK